MNTRSNLVLLLLAAVSSLVTAPGVLADTTSTNLAQASSQTNLQIEVTARKWTEPLQSVPGAVTIQTSDTLARAGAQDLRDATHCVPNLTLGDFSARRLTFPFMRGIGSGRNSPAVTTCIDGVPQLSYATANQQLIDIDRIEFLRGAQGTLYGRNTLGGVIN
ncbi:MAG: Plug domain-containing protein, partial [bacterium]